MTIVTVDCMNISVIIPDYKISQTREYTGGRDVDGQIEPTMMMA